MTVATAGEDVKSDRVINGGKWVVRAEGGTWPTPMDDLDGGLEWRLRYAGDAQVVKDRMLAASVVSAYRELILLPEKQRNRVIRSLRRAMKCTTHRNAWWAAAGAIMEAAKP